MADNHHNVDLVELHKACGYGSEFEYDSESEKRKAKRQDLIPKKKHTTDGLIDKQEVTREYVKEEGKAHRFHFLSLDAFSRHKKLVNDYLLYYSGSLSHFKRDISKDKTDLDVIRENHRFLWDDDEEDSERTWEKRLAKKYYDKLFKEYCIADLSRYKENKVAMRWRVEKELVAGKGQFICGNKRCEETGGLRTWEVNFGYVEHGEKKNALVKLRLCPDCSYKLNYHSKKREVRTNKRKSYPSDQTEDAASKRSKHEQPNSASDSENAAAALSKETSGGREKPKSTEKTGDSEHEMWSGPVKISEEKSREEEFDDYFADMFL